MTVEQKHLLYMMSLAVQGQPLEALPEGDAPDWKVLMKEACSQTVFLLFFDLISGVKEVLPEDVYQRYCEYARRCTVANMRIEHAQSELVNVLTRGGYPYVILKGESAATYYPVPELRQLGDVDFLVDPQQTEEITAAMVALGYRHSWEPGDYHQVLQKPGACLEMHMEVAGLPKGKTRQAVQTYLHTLFEDSRMLDRGFGAFRAPSEVHHGLILILHMQHHVLEKGMGLRHMMDWACFVNQTAQESFWEESLLPLLKKVGLFRFTAVITKMCAVYLKSAYPYWALDVEEALCQALMEDILSGGNFGRKDENRARATNMMPDWEKNQKKESKLKLLWRTLKYSACQRYPKLENKPVLLFFAMMGRAIRYVFLYLRGKRPNLWKAASHADTRTSIYEQLHLFETEQ